MEGKGKLLIVSSIIFISKKKCSSILLVLEIWVPGRVAHGPSDLLWKNKALGDGLRCDTPGAFPCISGAWWQWRMATQGGFPKASLKQAQDFLFDLAVYCHSYMKRKVWQEQISEHCQKGASKSRCVLGQLFSLLGTSLKLSLNSPQFFADCISANSHLDSHMGCKCIHTLITVLTCILK